MKQSRLLTETSLDLSLTSLSAYFIHVSERYLFVTEGMITLLKCCLTDKNNTTVPVVLRYPPPDNIILTSMYHARLQSRFRLSLS